MINAIGLQNPGAEAVVNDELIKLSKVYEGKVIANVGGHSVDEYVKAVEIVSKSDMVFAVELNISCPNVKGGGLAFGTDPKTAENLTREVKKHCDKPLIVKLSPNVTDVTELAKAVEIGGADGISLINTLLGMRLCLKTAKPIISTIKGGYSGIGVYPVALKMIYDVYKVTKIPIIGMGGVSSAENVIEMMYAGASAVMVGTQNLIDPYASKKIIDDLPKVMERYGIEKLSDIIGRAHNA